MLELCNVNKNYTDLLLMISEKSFILKFSRQLDWKGNDINVLK